MSKTISFVATDKLAEWIEEESDRRMTTVSSAAQQLLAEKFRAEQGASETAKPASDEPDEPDELDEPTTYRFQSKEQADAFRAEVSQHLADVDDKRLKEVTLAAGTPGSVVRKGAFEIGESAGSKGGSE